MKQDYLSTGAVRLVPEAPIPGGAALTVGDFWAWAYSDVLSNRNRSIFAEFLVGAALGVTDASVRREWDAVDLRYQGKKIEVKCSAYAQSWKQERPSQVRFDIAPKRAWSADTNEYGAVPSRVSDCYVFCHFTAVEDAFARVLDVSAWRFYPVKTKTIDCELGSLGTLSYSRLSTMSQPVVWGQLREAVESLWA